VTFSGLLRVVRREAAVPSTLSLISTGPTRLSFADQITLECPAGLCRPGEISIAYPTAGLLA
jgi:hypothetical protein